MAQGIGQGIASGLRIGTQNALNLGALSLRKQRQDALSAAEANTFQPSLSQQEEAFNIKQEENRANRDLAQANLKTTLQEKADQTDFDSIENHALKRWGENQTPGMAQELAILVNTIAPETVIDGNFTTDGINQAFAKINDPKNPIPGGKQLEKNIFKKGVEELKNMREANEADLQKLFKKDPMLATNPEALKRHKEAGPLAQAIEELRGGEQQFRQAGVEIEQFHKQQEDELREERNREINEMIEAFQNRVRGIETVQEALGTGGAPPRTAEALMVELSGPIADASGRPRQKVLLELMRPFETQPPLNQLMLAAIAAEVEVPNPFNITAEQADAILDKTNKSRQSAFVNAISAINPQLFNNPPSWFVRKWGEFFGGDQGIGADVPNALDDVQTQ